MDNINFKAGEYMRMLKVLHLALVLGVLVFALFAVFLNHLGDFSPSMVFLKDILLIMLLVLSVGCILAARVIFKRRMDTAKQLGSFNQKLMEYRAACLVKWALFEGASFIGAIFYMLTNDYLILAVTGVTMILFVFQAPSKESVIRDLELRGNEAWFFEKPDAD